MRNEKFYTFTNRTSISKREWEARGGCVLLETPKGSDRGVKDKKTLKRFLTSRELECGQIPLLQ
jgi:hypothetical protein